MLPYTKEGMEARDIAALRESAAAGASGDTDEKGGGKDTGGGSGGGGGVAGELPDMPILDEEDFMYELRGVLIHAGVAQSGHYYSFIRETETGKWFKFDDDDVTPWDPKDLQMECFGGTTTKTIVYAWYG